jgi:uncharacterized UPF0160 family protein
MGQDPKSCAIHDGTFHADEVVATVLLTIFEQIDEDKIVRTRDLGKIEKSQFVCDVGGIYDPSIKRFDHHQMDYEGSLSSAGMVLLFLKEETIISEKLYKYLNENVVMGIDAHDNGKSTCQFGTFHLSNCISCFNPIDYNVDDKERNIAFFKAFHFTKEIFQNIVAKYHYNESCMDAVKKAMSQRTDCLVFDQALSWQECFFELGGEDHPALFVIMPADGHWKLRAIPPNIKNRMQMRKPLPKKWAGLSSEELRRASGVEGAIFCHKGQFISIWKTKESALKALEKVIKRRVK